MAKNDNLHKAKDAKNDEFYTRIEDVAEELRHYKKHFPGKVVFCNCDDPTWSAFWRYFHLNFSELGLKKLISTHYDRTEPTYKMEYEDALTNKLQEEVAELLEAYTAKERSALDCAEEMADVMEVLYAMGKTCAVSKREVEQVRSQKAAEKGTFSKKIFLVSTEK